MNHLLIKKVCSSFFPFVFVSEMNHPAEMSHLRQTKPYLAKCWWCRATWQLIRSISLVGKLENDSDYTHYYHILGTRCWLSLPSLIEGRSIKVDFQRCVFHLTFKNFIQDFFLKTASLVSSFCLTNCITLPFQSRYPETNTYNWLWKGTALEHPYLQCLLVQRWSTVFLLLRLWRRKRKHH